MSALCRQAGLSELASGRALERRSLGFFSWSHGSVREVEVSISHGNFLKEQVDDRIKYERQSASGH